LQVFRPANAVSPLPYLTLFSAMNKLPHYSLALAVLAFAAATPAMAQERAEAPPPPRLEKLEEGEPPAVVIPSKPTEQQIVEKRDHGQVVETKVNTGGSTYYLKPNQSKGSALPGDLQSTANRPAQWQIMEFNTQRRKDVPEGQADQGAAPPAAAPSAAPAAAPAAKTSTSPSAPGH
jgi:hypothetical protein